MKQPEDIKTIDMLQPPKRGRGRPRVENPLTPAERARRYRERRRADGASRSKLMAVIRDEEAVTVNELSDEVEFWRGMYEAEAERVVELEARIAAGKGKSFSYANVTEITENLILKYMVKGASVADHDWSGAMQYRSWAQGIFWVWDDITSGWQADGDRDKLCALCEPK